MLAKLKTPRTLPHRWIGAALALVLAAGLSTALASGADGRWLHVRIDGNRDEQVNVNVPLSFVASVLPMIDSDELSGGILTLDDAEFEGIDLRQLLDAVRDSPDGDYITVRSRDEDVRVSKLDGFLRIDVEDGRDRVKVRFPLAVVDALLDNSNGNRLNLMAAIDALADYDSGDLVSVESSDGETVRIWIDSDQAGSR